jgi:DNA-binding protein
MIEQLESLLIKHTKEQLLSKGFVIIPNWGAFFLEPVSAHFDERSQRYFPPHYRILFNQNIKHHDGVLVISIIKDLNLSYFDVFQGIKDLTNQWQQEISTKGRLTINGFGTFEQNKNLISFSAENYYLTWPEYYGLKELLFENFNVEHSIIFSFPESQQKTISNWIKAAVIIPIAITFSLLPSKINHYSFENIASFVKKGNIYEQSLNITSENIERTLDTLTNLKIALKPDLKINNFELTKEQLNTETASKINITKPSKAETKASKYYYIIIGSLTTTKQVNEFKLMLEKKNIRETEVLNCNGKLRIAYNKYESRQEANDALELFKKNYPDLSAWILFW